MSFKSNLGVQRVTVVIHGNMSSQETLPTYNPLPDIETVGRSIVSSSLSGSYVACGLGPRLVIEVSLVQFSLVMLGFSWKGSARKLSLIAQVIVHETCEFHILDQSRRVRIGSLKSHFGQDDKPKFHKTVEHTYVRFVWALPRRECY